MSGVGKQAHWTGTIRPRDRQDGTAMFDFSGQKFGGNVEVTRATGEVDRTTIAITLTNSGSEGPSAKVSEVSWGLVVGRCGTRAAPVLPVTAFEPVELSSTGRGEVTSTIPFYFPTNGSYHIDIYAGSASSPSSVVACAELKYKEA